MAGAENAGLELCISGLPAGIDGGHLLMARSRRSSA